MSTQELLDQLKFRSIGPFRGGRCVAVAGVIGDLNRYYMGTTGGGIWTSDDAGIYWRNISDGFFKRASVGAIEVSVSDPNVIYVGMGETTIRSNVSHGDGVYRSDDAGQTWKHLGLEKTRNIGKVRIDPRDPDVAYVAAFGHVHGPNPERGLYRTRDGGKNWDLVLHESAKAGVNDLSLDPNNPRILYASSWEAHRNAYELSSGGEGSKLFKSTDGGDSWTDLTRKHGMPKGLNGKIGVSVSPARSGRVWALVENENGGLFRSDDGGETWELQTGDRNLRQRAWYYSHVIADPVDPDTVYVLNVQMHKSIDAGKTFAVVPVPHGDTHALWIDPKNNQRMILGDDGGATVSQNGGKTWTPQYSQPTSEMYHVAVDSRTPYRVYGSQQDNTSICLPSRSNAPFITRTEWHEVGGGEAGYIAIRPDNPNIVYAGEYMGFMSRYDGSTGLSRPISVWPEEYSGSGAEDYKYRFQWTYPIVLSPHDPNLLYCSGNHVFQTKNEGHSWECISPDLTRDDATTLAASGGPITKDNTGAEIYGTIFALAESPVKAGVIWAGSDDGLVHLTTDHGKSWANVTPKDFPDWGQVSIIEASPHDADTAFVAAHRYKHDDFAPYLFKTTDGGKHWSKITAGIEESDFLRTVRQDPGDANFIYAGTETGIYVSADGGDNWLRLGGNFPVVPVHDMVITNDELVVGTHGRAFWILDDLSLLRQAFGSGHGSQPHLFTPRATTRWGSLPSWAMPPVIGRNYQFAATQVPSYDVDRESDGDQKTIRLDAGANPPNGVVINYWLPEDYKGEFSLTIEDANGKALRTIAGKDAESEEPKEAEETFPPEDKEKPKDEDPKLPRKEGLNQFTWDFRIDPATKIATKGGDQPGRDGPRVSPGKYNAVLTFDGESQTASFEVLPDPRTGTSARDYATQFKLGQQVRDSHDQLNKSVNEIRSLRSSSIEIARELKDSGGQDELIGKLKAFCASLDEIEGVLLQPKIEVMQDSLNFPVRINGKLAAVAFTVDETEAKPTTQTEEHFRELKAQVDSQLKALAALKASELKSLNRQVKAANLSAISS